MNHPPSESNPSGAPKPTPTQAGGNVPDAVFTNQEPSTNENAAKSLGPMFLASGSPRRRQLLEEYGYLFNVIIPSPGAESGMCSSETPVQLVIRLAQQKAADIVPQVEHGIVLAADTVAHCQGTILGKPHNRQHAKEMLSMMSGQVHQVYTGVCIWHRPTNTILRNVVKTDLRMDELSQSVIEEYLDTDAWEGKSGAFGFQDGLDWVHIIEGEATNVVGLPMPQLAQMLALVEKEITGLA